MNKADRMQIKAVCVILGIVILLFAGISLLLKGNHTKIEEEEVKEPVIQNLDNTYITDITAEQITVFDGKSKTFTCNTANFGITNTEIGQICDLTVTDETVTAIELKNLHKINEKVMSVESGVGIELEKSGFINCTEDAKIYLLYGEMRTGTFMDIRIGYAFADFIIENGKICAILITRNEHMNAIRVLIKTSDYQSNYHNSVQLSCDADYTIKFQSGSEEKETVLKAGETISIDGESAYFNEGSDRIYIVPSVLTAKLSLLSVNRTQGVPGYRGSMELRKTENGIILINEVLLEEYLYGVVPSEMPQSYPMEALKAQAVCARTYAYSHMLLPGLANLGAHVDDSTGYQVYNNISDQSTTTDAVKETAGQVLYFGNDLVNTYYYSTSCGFGSDEHVWKSDNNIEYPYLNAKSISKDAFEGKELSLTGESMTDEATFSTYINGVQEMDFECSEPWYRWTYEVSAINSEQILKLLQDRYAVNQKLVLTLENEEYVSKSIQELGNIQKIYVSKRNAGGVADEVIIVGEKNTYKVISEFNIRYVLCDRITKVLRQDGSLVDMNSILPSAYFQMTTIEKEGIMVGYKLYGGGFGHGAGMSQNGAKNMALNGYTAKQILEFFFEDCIVQGVK